MDANKFVAGTRLVIEAYRTIEKPTLAEAENVVKFLEIGLLLLNKGDGGEGVMEELLAQTGTLELDPQEATDADVISLDAYRRNGGMLN